MEEITKMADKANQFEGVVESLLSGMNTVLSTKTVVGEPTQVYGFRE